MLFFFLLLFIVMGCGRKALPTLPEKPSSLIKQNESKIPVFKLVSIVKDFAEVFFDVTNTKRNKLDNHEKRNNGLGLEVRRMH